MSQPKAASFTIYFYLQAEVGQDCLLKHIHGMLAGILYKIVSSKAHTHVKLID